MRIIALVVAMACGVAAPAGAAAPSFPGSATVTVVNTEGALPIPDNSSLVLLLNVENTNGAIVDVDVSVDMQHPSPGQVKLQLLSPSGTLLALETNTGNNAANAFTNVTFDDQAPGTPSAANVRNVTYVSGQSIGVVQPEQPLAAIAGEPADGPWVLIVRDEQGGQVGTLRNWGLTITTVPLPSIRPDPPVPFDGPGINIPDNRPAGVTSTVDVSGVGSRLWDVDVTVSVTHNNSGDIDLYLTAPNGQRVDLVTAIGGGNDNLYKGTVFDDQSGNPISDVAPLPANGVAFDRVSGEGALGAFMGIDPNGTWTLTVADHQAGTTGKLDGWTLAVTTLTLCGDGNPDPGEVCDDGNSVDGDGCDANCTPTACGNGRVAPGEDCDDGNTADGDSCPSTCRLPEADCNNCVDDDGDGLTDAADPGCSTGGLNLRKGSFTTRGGGRDKLTLSGTLATAGSPSGPVVLVLGTPGQTLTCAPVGDVQGKKKRVRASAAGGTVSLGLSGRGGSKLTLSGRKLDLSALANSTEVVVGVRVGSQTFSGRATVVTKHGRKTLR